MIMQMANFRVGVPDMGVIQGVTGITGTEDAPLSIGSIYRRGRSPLWLKIKNPNAPAVKREAEEDWGR
jgi:hypothetical protein